MRSLIGWTTSGWWLVFASPACADEARDPSEVEPNDVVLDRVVGASVNTTTAVAQLTATGVSARSDASAPRTTSPGAPPLCVSGSPRCLGFATAGSLDGAWDGWTIQRDVSGPPGIWRKKRSR